MSTGKDLLRELLRAVATAVAPKKGRRASGGRNSGTGKSGTGSSGASGTSGRGTATTHARKGGTAPRTADHLGRIDIVYSPSPDGRPDPGEVVWAWVPYEDDPSRGKDRPVLLIGRDGDDLLGLMLTSQDHDRDAADEARWGRHWMDLGTGDWDRRGRPSEVRLDRILRLAPDAIRREGAILDRKRFRKVANSLIELKGW